MAFRMIVLIWIWQALQGNLFGQNPLFIPDTLAGSEISLQLQRGTHAFFPDQMTQTMGANGNILGPTLILQQGQNVRFAVHNQLGVLTSLHWHGMHVSPENDGGPHTPIMADSIWRPTFVVKDKASTYWYHPHVHHTTNEHVSKGIAGMILVRDNEEVALPLPRTYGKDDFPLVLQTKDFDAQRQIVTHSNNDETPMVNATLNPYLDIPAQVVRFRVLNGASQRSFMLGLSNNQSFFIIGTDGGLLEKPVSVKRLLISSGERMEILVNLTGMEGQNVQLMSYASELPNGIFGATNPGMSPMMMMHEYHPNPLNGTNYSLLQLNIKVKNDAPVLQIPETLVKVDRLDVANSNFQRNFLFTPSQMGMNQLNNPFLINNLTFDMEQINFTVPLGNTEVWELRNQSAISHPFHVHDVQFNILSRNGIPPTAYEMGRKDVVMVRPGETVRIIMQFLDYSHPEIPYMYHCHLLSHEDDGMMGQFLVASTSATEHVEQLKYKVSLYPNPCTDKIYTDCKNYSGEEGFVECRNSKGQLIRKITMRKLCEEGIDTESWPQGIYFLKIIQGKNVVTQSIAKVD